MYMKTLPKLNTALSAHRCGLSTDKQVCLCHPYLTWQNLLDYKVLEPTTFCCRTLFFHTKDLEVTPYLNGIEIALPLLGNSIFPPRRAWQLK